MSIVFVAQRKETHVEVEMFDDNDLPCGVLRMDWSAWMRLRAVLLAYDQLAGVVTVAELDG